MGLTIPCGVLNSKTFLSGTFYKMLNETDQHSQSGTSENVVCKLAFRAPQFWEADPAMWFGQVESQFIVSGISVDSTKFHAVVAALDTKVCKCVRDIILNPPATNAYEALKSRILSFYEKSESSKLKMLLSDLHLGDRRPSQLLYEMEGLNDGKMNPEALRALWMQRLPHSTQQILSVISDDITDLTKLAKIADKVYEGSVGTAHINQIDEKQISEFQILQKEIADLKDVVRNTKSGRSRSRTRSESRNRTRSPSAANSTNFDNCWYHRRFGEKAHRCVSPCKWSGNA